MFDQFTSKTHTADDIPRDGWNRPLIVPEGGGKPIAYTRTSKLAKRLDDTFALTRWKQRQVVIGLGKRPDLVAKASAVTLDADLYSIVEEAESAAGSSIAANIGTSLHAWAERIDAGAPVSEFQLDYQPDLLAYKQAMADITVIASELFVVTDEVKAAGTFDRLVKLPDGRVMVADVKTGKRETDYPLGATTQIAIYSRGHIYTHDQGRIRHLPTIGVDQDHGLLIHLPAGEGTCQLYLLDLQLGWRLARIAAQVNGTFASQKKFISKYTP